MPAGSSGTGYRGCRLGDGQVTAPTSNGGDARVGPASDPIPKAYRPFGRGRGILTRREGVDVRPRRAAGLPGN
jgi:hypothetical protein